MKDLLFKLLETPSPSGSELKIQKMVIEEMKDVADKVITHHNYNVINVINPESETKILLSGHIDEIGLYIEEILSNGTCKMARAGGIRPYMYCGQHVVVINSEGAHIPGVIGYIPNMDEGKLKLSDLTLDLGTSSKEETMKLIALGDPVVHKMSYQMLQNDFLSGRALDDKLGAYIVLEVLRRCKEQQSKIGVYASTTVGEETTGRGAKIAAGVVNPTCAIAIDVSYATDIKYSADLSGDTSLGKGPILTRGSIMNSKIHELLKASAARLNMNVQMDVAPSRTYTDADDIYDRVNGIPTYLISIPLRYMHSSVEVCSLSDVEDIIKLLVDFIMNFDPQTNFDPFS